MSEPTRFEFATILDDPELMLLDVIRQGFERMDDDHQRQRAVDYLRSRFGERDVVVY